MPSRTADIPAESALLCENCGYVLIGLPLTGQCPECAAPISDSLPTHRQPAPIEQPNSPHGSLFRFLSTTASVLFTPEYFFRRLAIHLPPSLRFARIHWAIASVFFALTIYIHTDQMTGLPTQSKLLFLLLTLIIFLCLESTTRFAARLTTWEASYRGLRLPLPIVRRALYFHAAHYLPVALLTTATVLGYHLLLSHQLTDIAATGVRYLYALSAEVVICAFYLFWTYWIGMKNLMYANR